MLLRLQNFSYAIDYKGKVERSQHKVIKIWLDGENLRKKMKREKSIKQKRIERKRHALSVVLDNNRETQHFWDALLISNIDNVIDSIEYLGGSIDNIVMSIEDASRSANKLSKRIFWLNIILVIIGALALSIAGYGVFFK